MRDKILQLIDFTKLHEDFNHVYTLLKNQPLNIENVKEGADTTYLRPWRLALFASIVVFILVIILSSVLKPGVKKPDDQTGVVSSGVTAGLDDPDLDIKVYLDLKNNFQFKYPASWKYQVLTVNKGLNKTEPGRLDVSAFDGQVEIIKLTKGQNWELRIEVQGEFEKDRCGGFGPFTKDDWTVWLDRHVSLNILNREAYRTALEYGLLPDIGGDQVEPFPVPILFKRLEGELAWMGDFKKTPEGLKFCYEDPSRPLRIRAVYYSNYFTKDNIENKLIDTKTLSQMDSILKSLSFSK